MRKIDYMMENLNEFTAQLYMDPVLPPLKTAGFHPQTHHGVFMPGTSRAEIPSTVARRHGGLKDPIQVILTLSEATRNSK